MMFGKAITSIWLIQIHLSPPPILEKSGYISRITFKFRTFRPRIDKPKQSGDPTPSNNQKVEGGRSRQSEKANTQPRAQKTIRNHSLPQYLQQGPLRCPKTLRKVKQ